MKTRMYLFSVAAALAGLLAFSAGSLAAKPDWAGGGGGPGSGGGEDGGEVVTPDYGDLIKLYRDDYGVPIPSPETTATDPDGLPAPGGLCWQPLAFNFSVPPEEDDSCPEECVVNSVPAGEAVVAVNQYSCAVADGCSGCTQEVDFGRMNDARAPDSVFASQLADVVVNLATADCVTLDPAGRLVTSRVETFVEDEEEYDVVTSGAIDSPLQNLAIYKQLMMYGYLGDELNPIDLPASALDTAARGLGAASDKGGEVNVDKVAYLNSLMGLDDVDTILPKRCETYREEVMGVIQLVEKCFLNYGTGGSQYGYTRNANFSALPAPAYIPATKGGPPMEGWFEVLAPDDVTEPFDATFAIFRGPIFDTVFGDGAGSGGSYGIADFAQAADDARAVINYMHSWPLPADYATPFESCIASGDIAYDVSISAESGLQVPVQMVATTDTTEGREFIVTVANAGPDPATGRVLVTVETSDGDDTIVVEIADDADEDSPYWVDGENRFEFPFKDLAEGASDSWTVMFTMNEIIATKLNWTATIDAEKDVLLGNNTVDATTNVRVTGSGGGGGRR